MVFLQNFLDPIAKVWGDTKIIHSSNSSHKRYLKLLKANKKLKKRLPK
jgi:hypothetical protein